STACINNLAVQELNTKAKTFIDNGDIENAISRLKSSVDLDPTIFESHYNLAVAYTRAENYSDAIESYMKAIELKPDFADSYYSLAVCEENLAGDIKSGEISVNEDGTLKKLLESELEEIQALKQENKFKISKESETKIVELLEDSVKNFKTYVEMNPTGDDVEDANNEINSIEEKLKDYSVVAE
ncbi:tetratricopeptide repeat protein, partial [bacterium]|nr:tetratricopeptide repeat protein [bacterium]